MYTKETEENKRRNDALKARKAQQNEKLQSKVEGRGIKAEK
jgi:hypothetical protein